MLNPAQWQELVAAARDASTRAYCPYSHFAVGAAVRVADGRVFTGCNVENASYGLTVCAERNAIFAAAAAGGRDIAALVVYTPTDSPVAPCGACRQVLHEFGANAEVVCACNSPHRLTFQSSELLPHGFSLKRN